MSISGNNHSSGNSGSRTSIFEAFHTPSFGDDNFEVQPQSTITQPVKTYTRQPVVAQGALTLNSQTGSSSSLQSLSREEESKTEEEEIFDEEDESSGENAVTTLWMSCSPGRDSTDDEEEEEGEEVAPSQEEEEDEGDEVESESSDDGLPLSKLAGKRFLERGLKPPSAKRSKPPKPLRLRKDKKGPKKNENQNAGRMEEQASARSETKKASADLKLKVMNKNNKKNSAKIKKENSKNTKQQNGEIDVSVKKKDPAEPKRPLSAYAFFYRDTQMAIKSQNPQATFGEISKIVASMWDRLDGELKEVYKKPFRYFLCRSLSAFNLFFRESQDCVRVKNPLSSYEDQYTAIAAMWDELDAQIKEEYNKRAEENKKEYIKQLAEYCALNKDRIPPSAKSKQKKAKKSSSSSKPKRKPLESDSPPESQDRVMEESEPKDETDNLETSRRSSESSERMMSPKQDEKQEKPKPICNYTKCQNPAIDDPRWENNYCSSECVIMHCKDVFNAWVANRKSAYCET